MTEQPDDLPRRFSGQLDLPEPLRPVYRDTREDVLVRVRDGLERYEPPLVKEPAEDFRGWMQPDPGGQYATEPEPEE